MKKKNKRYAVPFAHWIQDENHVQPGVMIIWAENPKEAQRKAIEELNAEEEAVENPGYPIGHQSLTRSEVEGIIVADVEHIKEIR